MDIWHHEIDQATTEAEVAARANDFLALWAPRELAPVTLGWRPVAVRSAGDVERLKRWLLAVPAAQMAPLKDLARYVWHAATRMREVRP